MKSLKSRLTVFERLHLHHFNRLGSFGSVLHLEVDPVALTQRTETICNDCGVMNEYVPLILGFNETVPFLSLNHLTRPSGIVIPFFLSVLCSLPVRYFESILSDRLV